VQDGGTELVQPPDRPTEQVPDHRLRGGITGQFVQVVLDGAGGVGIVYGIRSRR